MKDILKKLGIDEQYTKPVKIPKKAFNKVKDNVPHVPHYNYEADLLTLPTTKQGFNALLVVVDLGNDEFDIEPIKNKEASTILTAFKEMFKRPYIKEPYASVRTDGGGEFKGPFQKYLYDKSIYHGISEPDRHKQMANVESLNRQLGRLFNGYMNAKEISTGIQYNEWTDILKDVRKDLNEHRKKPTGDPALDKYKIMEDVEAKYKVGDIVYRISEVPLNALGHEQTSKKFRMGDYRWDLVPRKIVKVLRFGGDIPVRYVLNYKKNVSYAEYELRPAKEKQEMFIVREIIGRKVVTENKKKITKYEIWWKGFLKNESTWESKEELIKDGFKKEIETYDKLHL
jgi:hypothetical protein